MLKRDLVFFYDHVTSQVIRSPILHQMRGDLNQLKVSTARRVLPILALLQTADFRALVGVKAFDRYPSRHALLKSLLTERLLHSESSLGAHLAAVVLTSVLLHLELRVEGQEVRTTREHL